MRSFLLTISVVFVCFASSANADIAHLYHGHGGDIVWTPDTYTTPLFKIGGALGPTPGTGAYDATQYFASNPAPAGVTPSAWTSNVINQGTSSIDISQQANVQLNSTNFSGLHRQIDSGFYTYYAFTVSKTEYYNLDFELRGEFFGNAINLPLGHPNSYTYTGTGAYIEFYDLAMGPQNYIAKLTFSGGESDISENYPVDPSQFDVPLVRTLSKSVLLEAGKQYQVTLSGYVYRGADGQAFTTSSINNRFLITAVPEPTSFALIAATLSLSAVQTYRKRRRGIA